MQSRGSAQRNATRCGASVGHFSEPAKIQQESRAGLDPARSAGNLSGCNNPRSAHCIPVPPLPLIAAGSGEQRALSLRSFLARGYKCNLTILFIGGAVLYPLAKLSFHLLFFTRSSRTRDECPVFAYGRSVPFERSRPRSKWACAHFVAYALR